MDGEGGEAVGRRRLSDATFDLPSVLARLDSTDPADQRAAVERVRDALEDQPQACLPAVPKLRALLGAPALDCHETIAYCLAELAAESASDVAPSVPELVASVAEQPRRPAASELLRCLAIVADEQPAIVAEHADQLLEGVAERPVPDPVTARLVYNVAGAEPTAVASAVPLLTESLVAAPETGGATVLSALGRIADGAEDVPTLQFVDPVTDLVDHEDDSLRRNAVGCLADVARRRPAAVAPVADELVDALEHPDPETRANAAVALARVAAGTDVDLEPASDALVDLLEDDHERSRANACVAIAHGRLDGATDRLRTRSRVDPSATVRRRAGWALERLS